MKKIIIFNTSVGSLNTGDYVINESGRKQLSDVLKDNFIVELPTHTPAVHNYQSINRNKLIQVCNSAEHKFIIGTNILAYNNLVPWPNWNVNIFNSKPYNNSIMVGVGSTPNAKNVNHYTKFLYKRILSHNFIHSTRDEKTKNMLESIGLRAINTGCVTMWEFTSEKCARIPKEKSSQVVFTLTDYAKDIEKDQELINILRKNYKTVYFWPQGSDDYEYILSLGHKNIRIISPQLDYYRSLLQSGSIDFVGTRLHAGVFAMQNNVRSIILIVDNRARDIQENYNINAIERDELSAKLDSMINSTFTTDIKISQDKINEWKSQFSK